MKTLIQNGTLVHGGRTEMADILIENGTICDVSPGIQAEGARVIDAAGCYVFAGFIDTHTHFDLELGAMSTADDFVSGTRAAILGGTTTVLDFATQSRGMSMQDALGIWRSKAIGSSCHYGFHMALSDWDETLAGELDSIVSQGISSFKMYMVYSHLRVNDGQIYEALKRLKTRDCVLGVHCENDDVIQARIRELREAGQLAPAAHPRARPNAAEAEGVARYMRIAELAGAPAWVVHLSTKEGLEEARRARARGQEVYLETCPQYLVLDDRRYQDADAAKFVMSPPLRKPADNEALLEALANGEIDVIGTDHCSFTMAQKALGQHDFTKIPNGGAGVQNRPALVYSYAVQKGRITLPQMAALLSENAARLFGMYPQKGALRAHSDADITIYDPRGESVISYKTNAHNCDNSPYEGMRVQGRVRDVLLLGEHVVRDGQLYKEGMGRFVMRGRSLRPRR
jgi:dihydropyrimidinase